MSGQENLDECYKVIEILVLEAGKVIAEAIDKDKVTETKTIDYDMVTEYDRKVENTLVTSLANKFPNHKFIGEESAAANGLTPNLTNDPTWIIDPIDGTTNFVHRFPQVCVSVALLIKKRAEIGIIYNPMMNQFFTARRGKGAFLNGKPIKTSSVQDLSLSLVAMEPWIAKEDPYRAHIYRRMDALIHQTHGIRSLGTAALTLCYVAMGAVEAYHVESIEAWDVAAAQLIIEEAGGIVIDTAGGELDLMKPRVIAACNRKLACQLVELFNEADTKPINVNLTRNC
ncbi:inositol monophosphatase 2-like [Venturia canescens]|uniref:inositol monophosphatase 2-like n=1 Tax=Venturia canescens TaxID=32260 RepID=UPI001C9BC126|nr:inositol monophosphatase 2-like [Venturia canescens]